MKQNFLITTGGSGGHVLPAKILYQHLSKEAKIIISTDNRGLRYLDKDLFQVEIINTPKLDNIFFLPYKLIIILFLTFKSFFLLRKRNIKKIISTGGYMSLPLILAAKSLKINIYLIEPNQVLGRANKFFLSYCKKIFCYSEKIKNFPEKFRYKITIIDPLIREEVYKLNLDTVPEGKLNLLIIGGSQGADIFDNNLKKSIVNISKNTPIKIVQQTSEKNISDLSEYYFKNKVECKIFSFEKNIDKIFNQTDICITRAGASTLAELSFLNIPFIAVPLPSSKDNHQFENANFYKKKDCCWIIEQKYFEEKIEEVLKDIIQKKNDYVNKKENLKKLNNKNTWINVNQKLLKAINEN